MTGADDRPEEFRPPTALESAVRAVGADTIRYQVDYIMLPMRDGIRLATVVFRPRGRPCLDPGHDQVPWRPGRMPADLEQPPAGKEDHPGIVRRPGLPVDGQAQDVAEETVAGVWRRVSARSACRLCTPNG